jgi:hypothetical protein|tara:strand:+ start:3187 stop:3471 length:285 start_codon:yes stop_codon:yes gene_type:complete
MYYSKEEKVKIIVDIIKKLKTFPTKNGSTIDLYNKQYNFVEKFKTISMNWVNTEHSEFEGSIYFEELNKYFEYNFPSEKKTEPLFVLRNNKFFK